MSVYCGALTLRGSYCKKLPQINGDKCYIHEHVHRIRQICQIFECSNEAQKGKNKCQTHRITLRCGYKDKYGVVCRNRVKIITNRCQHHRNGLLNLYRAASHF